MSMLKTALQIYSVRDEAEKNLKETLRQIAEYGYDGVEFAGLYGHAPEEVRDMVNAFGLTPISAHVPYEELAADLDGTIDKYVTIGCPYIAIPYLSEELRPGSARFEEAIEYIKTIGEACKKKNVILLYHNHDFEFVRMPNGAYGLDYLYQAISPDLLQTEIDPCWVRVAGLDPVAYVKQYAGRCPVVQLKDFVGGKSEQGTTAFEFRAVGYGVQDFPAIIDAAKAGGAVWQIVEQDSHNANTPMEDARLSIEYLKSIHKE